MTVNRLVFSGLVVLYMVVGTLAGGAHAQRMLIETRVYFVLYFAISFAIFGHILAQPGSSPVRRVVAMIHDLTMISVAAEAGGVATGFFYPLYLWTIFGNGFRFGVRYLYAAMVVAVAGFLSVLAVTSFWYKHPGLAFALLAGLILLPLYVSRLIQRLSEAKRQAEEASRAKSLFLASVSHELRTPLNAIIGLSSLLQEQGLEREPAEMARAIGSAGRSLLRLITSILDLSRAEAGRRVSAVSVFDVYGLVAEVRSMLATQAREKGLRLAMHITARTPQFVSGDQSVLEEVLVNLVGNAIKFTAAGSVVIAVDALPQGREGLRLRCEVTDTGIGIAPEAQTRIFENFTQADETIIDRFGGTGLGLAICKQLVSLHGGEIGVESSPGQGSTFWFELDLGTAADAGSLPDPCPALVVLSSDADLRAAVHRVVPAARCVVTAADARADLVELLEEGVHEAVVLLDERAVAREGETVALDRLIHGLGRAPLVIRFTAEDGALPARGERRARTISTVAWPCTEQRIAAALSIAATVVGPRGDTAVPQQSEPVGRRPCSVLVAEDNRTNQMVIAKILERAGHRVMLVDNGDAALEALLGERRFDVVLMDINMPVMNGIQTAKLYRFSSLGHERVPIIGLTADATAETLARCEEAGMDACATKPIEPQHLLELIDSVLPKQAAVATEFDWPSADPGNPKRSVGNGLDLETLEDLERLGGPEFIHQLVAQFVGDAAAALRRLSQAVAEENVQAFRDQAHALRSCAANVGAQSIFELCLSWRQISPRELAMEGERYLRQLTAEFQSVQAMLEAHLSQRQQKMLEDRQQVDRRRA